MRLSINTRLDCINYIIGCIGLSPVDAEDEYNLDVAQAALAMDNISRRIQDNRGQGWWFNRERNWRLSADPVTKEVLIPNTALAVYYIDRYRNQRRMATRGRMLYDPNQHRFDMTTFLDDGGYMNVTIVNQLEFDDLPFTVKDAIATEAGVRFATSNEMDVNRIKILNEVATEAKYAMEAEDTAQQKNNAFKDNSSMLLFDGMAGGYNNY